MSDLFSGQNAILPWLQRTIHKHLLDTLEDRHQSDCAEDEQEEDVARRSKKSKPVQIVDLQISGDRDYSSSFLLISDGANSIVAELVLPLQGQPSLVALTRGCMIRMEDWEIHVEPLCPPRNISRNGRLFQQHAVSNHGNTAVYLKVSGNVVTMGNRDVTGRPEPVIQDTDIQRVLISMAKTQTTTTTTTTPPGEPSQQDALPEGVDDHDENFPTWPTDGDSEQEGFLSSDAWVTICQDAAPPPVTSDESYDLPLGNIPDLFLAGHAVMVAVCEEALTTQANALSLASSEDDDQQQQQLVSEQMERLSNEVQATNLEERQSRDSEKMPQRAPASSTDIRTKAQREPANAHSSQTIDKPASVQDSSEESDDDDDDEANQGIGNMLIDPTPSETRGSAEAMTHDYHTSQDKLLGRDHVDDDGEVGSKPGPFVLPSATINEERVVEMQKPDSEPADGEETKGKDGDNDNDLETQPLDIHVGVGNKRAAGEASDKRTGQLRGRQTVSELISTSSKSYPDRKKAAKRNEPETADVSASFVSNTDRFFSIVDSAGTTTCSEKPSSAKRTEGFRFGGDSLRAFLE